MAKMKFKIVFHYLFGYAIGGTIFGFLIPFGLRELSINTNHFIQTWIPENIFIKLLAWLLLFIGIVFIIWSNIYLFTIGKGGPADVFGVAASPRTKHLVIKGPYKYSRNPMVFGAFSSYLATAVLFNSIFGLAIVILSISIMILILKLSEEKRLLRDFGEHYIEYKQKVAFLIPWFHKTVLAKPKSSDTQIN
jgi:protein-S-isoprenylcysteine O-methyltransferase Ste14